MHLYRLDRTQRIPRSRQEVFEFFQDPKNLSKITPKDLHFKNLSISPQGLRAGAQIVHQIKVKGVPIRWVSMITQFKPPESFSDEQLKGPYAHWEHLHLFKEERGGTRMEDHVRYALPLGPLGRLAHLLFVQRQLKQIFDYRREKIKEMFGE